MGINNVDKGREYFKLGGDHINQIIKFVSLNRTLQ
jgi:hypothetical protein